MEGSGTLAADEEIENKKVRRDIQGGLKLRNIVQSMRANEGY